VSSDKFHPSSTLNLNARATAVERAGEQGRRMKSEWKRGSEHFRNKTHVSEVRDET